MHHECIFHALQQAQEHVKEVYGADYAAQHPAAEQLKQQIYRIFDAATLTVATQRYAAVVARRQDDVQAWPEAAVIFDFLERHWPRLSNSIESSLIPATNNTVERVIGRFDQHYQNFCGFESIADAQRYLAVLRRSTAARPSHRMPSPASAASARCNWPATTSASCPWRPSAPASALLAATDPGGRRCPQVVTL